MIEFLYHDNFQKEIAVLARRFNHLHEGLEIFKRLCDVQFHTTNPKQVIAPAKLHRVIQNDLWTLWKIEMVVPKAGLRPNQYPRVWFTVKGSIIAFLCITTHIDNYSDNEMNKIALFRVSDIF